MSDSEQKKPEGKSEGNFFTNMVKTVKRFFGLEGVRVGVVIDPDCKQVTFDAKPITGKILLETTELAHVRNIVVELKRTDKTMRDGKVAKEQDFIDAKMEIDEKFDLVPGKQVEKEFKLSGYVVKKSMGDSLKEKGGAMKLVGMMAKGLDNVNSFYQVDVKVHLENSNQDYKTGTGFLNFKN